MGFCSMALVCGAAALPASAADYTPPDDAGLAASPGFRGPPSHANPAMASAASASAMSGKKISARAQAIAAYDTDGDGKLSQEERQAARTTLQKQRRLLAASGVTGTGGAGGGCRHGSGTTGSGPTTGFAGGAGAGVGNLLGGQLGAGPMAMGRGGRR
jgi:hypothetical protein